MVGPIVRLGTQLNPLVFIQVEGLRNGEVMVLKSRPVDDVPNSLRIESTRARSCEDRTAVRVLDCKPIVCVGRVVRKLSVASADLRIAAHNPILGSATGSNTGKIVESCD